MAYDQYTSCTPVSSFNPMNQYVQATIASVLLAGLGAAIVIAAGMTLCALHAIAVMAYLWVIVYCDWWLYHRLICLDGEKSVIGAILSVTTPDEKSFPDSLDTDFSIDLLAYPGKLHEDQLVAAAHSPYGVLLGQTPTTQNSSLPFTGEFSGDTAILHAEFEGRGILDWQIGAMVAFALAVTAMMVCLIPVVGWIISIFLEILAFLAWLFGTLFGQGDTADPESDPSIGDIHPLNTNPLGADVVFVKGRWVYDAGHNNQGKGYNELHPITYFQKIGTYAPPANDPTAPPNWPADIDDLVARYTNAVGEAQSPLTRDNQQKPEHQWSIYPLIDGCTPSKGTGTNQEPH